MTTIRGIVINMHQLGATVRLEDGTLAAIPPAEVMAHRAILHDSMIKKQELPFAVARTGRRPAAFVTPDALARTPAPQLTDNLFEERMNTYLRSVADHESLDGPPPAERHFIRKKKRAAIFEARTTQVET
ncbi:MAG TPA: hypothetical protein VGD50_04075 [Candidatus Baltobacteraceae bacterium]